MVALFVASMVCGWAFLSMHSFVETYGGLGGTYGILGNEDKNLTSHIAYHFLVHETSPKHCIIVTGFEQLCSNLI